MSSNIAQYLRMWMEPSQNLDLVVEPTRTEIPAIRQSIYLFIGKKNDNQLIQKQFSKIC